ncbi:hypothetical protein [Actinosynnema sp.]|uniref:hypothetical protein n=1 Tax=Actinosynnema sp. TaxID=1872144 RepID=UPI003F86B9DD
MLKWAEGGVGQFLHGVMLAESHVADRIDSIGARPARNTKSPSAAQVTRWSWRSAPANPDARGGGPL